jgi:hypothetical protein
MKKATIFFQNNTSKTHRYKDLGVQTRGGFDFPFLDTSGKGSLVFVDPCAVIVSPRGQVLYNPEEWKLGPEHAAKMSLDSTWPARVIEQRN